METIVAAAITAALLLIAWKGWLDATGKLLAASVVFVLPSSYFEYIILGENIPSGFLGFLLFLGPVIVFWLIAIERADSKAASSATAGLSTAEQIKRNDEAARQKRHTGQTRTAAPTSNAGTITLNSSFFHCSTSLMYHGAFSNGTVYASGFSKPIVVGYYAGKSIYEETHRGLCGLISPSMSAGGKCHIVLYQGYIRDNVQKMLQESPRQFQGMTTRQPDAKSVAHFYTDSTFIWDDDTDQLIATFTGDPYGAAAALVCLIQYGCIEPYYSFYHAYTENALIWK